MSLKKIRSITSLCLHAGSVYPEIRRPILVRSQLFEGGHERVGTGLRRFVPVVDRTVRIARLRRLTRYGRKKTTHLTNSKFTTHDRNAEFTFSDLN